MMGVLFLVFPKTCSILFCVFVKLKRDRNYPTVICWEATQQESPYPLKNKHITIASVHTLI